MRSLILVNGERTYRLREIAKLIDDRPCQKTVYRWCTEGRHGVLLEKIDSPHGYRTSLEAYWRFMDGIQGK